MASKIVWTKRAKLELIDIFEYWNNRNKSNFFSVKLNTLIQEQLILLLQFPNIGKKTDIQNVFVKIIQNYLLYYEIIDDKLYVLSIRHGSRNLKMTRLK